MSSGNPFENQDFSDSPSDNPYGAPSAEGGYSQYPRPTNNNALVFGIISVTSVAVGLVMICCCSFFEVPFSIIGIVLGIVAWKSADTTLKSNPTVEERSQANTAKLLGIIGVVLHVFVILLVLLFVMLALAGNSPVFIKQLEQMMR